MTEPSAPSTAPAAAEAAADGADPSMEEILASIRRILDEDEPPAATAHDAGTEPEDDVLLLDESMLVADPVALPRAVVAPPEPEPMAPPPVIVAPEPEPMHQAQPESVTSPNPDDAHRPAPPNEGLVAPEAAAAAASSVSSLMRSLAAGRSTQVWSGGPTLEDIVRAELRPLLKEWLDVNLPPLAERLVRIEIERVVGRAVP